MIKLFLTCLVVLSFQANAIELLGYKADNSGFVYTKATIDKLWSSDQPACLKEGGKILGVNKAYKNASLKYQDCSSTEKRKRIHKAQGISVTVVKLSELPMEMIKEIKSKK